MSLVSDRMSQKIHSYLNASMHLSKSYETPGIHYIQIAFGKHELFWDTVSPTWINIIPNFQIFSLIRYKVSPIVGRVGRPQTNLSLSNFCFQASLYQQKRYLFQHK